MKKNKYNDEEIINGLRNGDDAILNFLYDNYYGSVRSLILKSYGNEDQAQDIFQEVIIVIYNKLQNSEFKITSSFFTFFYAVIKYTWLDYRKVNKRNPLGNATDIEEELIASMDNNEAEILATAANRNSLFLRYFNLLAESCQRVLKLAMEGYKAEDIAKELNYKSANYVRKRKSKCISILVEKIRKDSLFKELI